MFPARSQFATVFDALVKLNRQCVSSHGYKTGRLAGGLDDLALSISLCLYNAYRHTLQMNSSQRDSSRIAFPLRAVDAPDG